VADASPAGPPVGFALLLVLAVVLYAGMMGSLADAPNSDAMGRGLALAFGALIGTVLSLVLAALLIVAAVRGSMSLWGRIGAFILLPLATVAMWLAGDAYGARDYSAILIPALLPPLFALYAVRARFPSLRRWVSEGVANIVLGGAILLLIGTPLARAAFPTPRDPAAEARAMVEEKARIDREEERQRENQRREEAQFAALGPQSSMADYLPFIFGERSGQARDGIRKVNSRQADTVALLNDERLRDLADLLEFDVDATPELCAAYGAALAKAAAQVDPKVNSNYIGAAIDLEGQLRNLEWLVGEHCALAAPIALLEKNVRTNADSSRMTKFADALADLRKLR
jgi:hypothetical protein